MPEFRPSPTLPLSLSTPPINVTISLCGGLPMIGHKSRRHFNFNAKQLTERWPRVCTCVCVCVYTFDAVCWCQYKYVCVRGCIAVCVTVSAAFSSKEFCSVGVKYYDPVKLLWRCCLPTHANTHTQRYIYNHLLSDTCMRHTHTHTRSGNPLHKYSL